MLDPMGFHLACYGKAMLSYVGLSLDLVASLFKQNEPQKAESDVLREWPKGED